MTQVHMLWVNGSLSPIERLSCKSFLKNGYTVNLWTYEPVANIPEGVTVRDANTILDSSHLFLTKNSYANFSDLFRYAVLHKIGGLWSDIDVVAVKPESELPREPFFVVEDIWEGSWRKDKPYTINGNVIHLPNPEYGDVIHLALEYALLKPKHNLVWSELGPDLLHNFLELNPANNARIMPVEFANYFKAGEIIKELLKPNKIPQGSHFIHLYNDMWKREGIDKHNLVPPEGSLLSELIKQYE